MRLTYAVFERGDVNCRGKIGEEARSATVGSPHLDSHLGDGWGMKRNREEEEVDGAVWNQRGFVHLLFSWILLTIKIHEIASVFNPNFTVN